MADKLDRADAQTHIDLGVAYEEMGLVKDAIAEFEKALDLDPSNSAARRYLERARRRDPET